MEMEAPFDYLLNWIRESGFGARISKDSLLGI